MKAKQKKPTFPKRILPEKNNGEKQNPAFYAGFFCAFRHFGFCKFPLKKSGYGDIII